MTGDQAPSWPWLRLCGLCGSAVPLAAAHCCTTIQAVPHAGLARQVARENTDAAIAELRGIKPDEVFLPRAVLRRTLAAIEALAAEIRDAKEG